MRIMTVLLITVEFETALQTLQTRLEELQILGKFEMVRTKTVLSSATILRRYDGIDVSSSPSIEWLGFFK